MISSTEKFRKAMGKRILKAREARGLSQPDLAEAADVSRAAVSLWENGKSGIEQNKLLTIAERLRVDAVWLQYGRGEEPDLTPRQGRKALRHVGSTIDLGWSNDANDSPFENAVAEMKDQLGIGAPVSEDDGSVRDWWRLPTHALEGCGVADYGKLRIFNVASDTVTDVPKGTLVVVDTQQREFEDGKIYVIDIGTSRTLKRAVEQIGAAKKIGLTDASGITQVIERNKVKVTGRVIAKFSCL